MKPNGNEKRHITLTLDLAFDSYQDIPVSMYRYFFFTSFFLFLFSFCVTIFRQTFSGIRIHWNTWHPVCCVGCGLLWILHKRIRSTILINHSVIEALARSIGPRFEFCGHSLFLSLYSFFGSVINSITLHRFGVATKLQCVLDLWNRAYTEQK